MQHLQFHSNIFVINLVTHSSVDPSFLEGYQILIQKTPVTVGTSTFCVSYPLLLKICMLHAD